MSGLGFIENNRQNHSRGRAGKALNPDFSGFAIIDGFNKRWQERMSVVVFCKFVNFHEPDFAGKFTKMKVKRDG